MHCVFVGVALHIMFWRFLAASRRVEETVYVNKKSNVNENSYSVHSLILIILIKAA